MQADKVGAPEKHFIEAIIAGHGIAIAVILISLIAAISGFVAYRLWRRQRRSEEKESQTELKVEYLLFFVPFITGMFIRPALPNAESEFLFDLGFELLVVIFIFNIQYGAPLKILRDDFPDLKTKLPEMINRTNQLLTKVNEALVKLEDHKSIPQSMIGVRDQLERINSQSVMLEILEEPLSKSWIMRHIFLSLINDSRKALTELRHGRFEMNVVSVPDISIQICQALSESGFCTALVDENFFIFRGATGEELLDANGHAAKRLKQTGLGGFTRIFILNEYMSLTPEVAEVMHRQKDKGIDVRVALWKDVEMALRRNHLSKFATREKMDFGIWDDCVIHIKPTDNDKHLMTGNADSEEIREMKEVRSVLLQEQVSRELEEFEREISKPINTWKDFDKGLVTLPPPNGPHADDVKKMFEILNERRPDAGKIAILGLTLPLMQETLRIRDERAKSPGSTELIVEVVDQRDHSQDPAFPRFIFSPPTNWLTWKQNGGALNDAILGDDVLCNLAPWQLPKFFESVSAALKPKGILVIRTTGIFSYSLDDPILDRRSTVSKINTMLTNNFKMEQMVHAQRGVPYREAVLTAVAKLEQEEKLKNGLRQIFAAATQEEQEGACYEIAWPMLHSRDYYDDFKCRFKLGDWNKAVSQQNSKNEPLPPRERFNPEGIGFLRLSHADDLTMTSLTKKQIEDYASYHFRLEPSSREVYSIWDNHPMFSAFEESSQISTTFKNFYKILVFTKLDR